MEFYRINDYRKGLKWGLERLASRGEKITSARLAEAMGVQSPYLSKVFSGLADLNDDQLFMACEALKLSSEESKYLRLLLSHARAGIKIRRDELQKEITLFQNMKLSPAEARDAKRLGENADALAQYYLDPWAQLIHMFLTIPKWRKNPTQLAGHTGLAPERLSAILKTLEELEIIEHKSGTYHLHKDQLHLPKTSPLCAPQQNLMKLMSMQRTQRMEAKENYSFNASFTANEAARTEIQGLFSEFLKKVERIVKDAPPENVYQIQFDLFPWAE